MPGLTIHSSFHNTNFAHPFVAEIRLWFYSTAKYYRFSDSDYKCLLLMPEPNY